MKRLIAPLSAATVLALAGGATALAQPVAQHVAKATAKVRISGYAFHPAVLHVKMGTTVVWTNTDNDNHTVTASAGKPQSGTLGHKGTFRFTFKKAGKYRYHCSYHPYMTGMVVVAKH